MFQDKVLQWYILMSCLKKILSVWILLSRVFYTKTQKIITKKPNCEVKIDLMSKKEQWRSLGTAAPGCLTE